MQTSLSSSSAETGRGQATTLTRRRLLRVSLLAVPFLVAACNGPLTSTSSTPAAAPLPTPLATATTAIAAVAPTSTLAPIATVVASPTGVSAAATPLAATDASVDPGEPTVAVTEGPYFKANSPERASLRDAGVVGTPLTLSGQVVSTKGQPIARALLDFWQADGKGSYDNTGFLLRGHQFTDAEGKYQLETVVPGLYPGRTRHIHVKVQAPNGPILTTQLFFPGEAQNAADSIFNARLLVAETDGPNASKLATFKFVLNAG